TVDLHGCRCRAGDTVHSSATEVFRPAGGLGHVRLVSGFHGHDGAAAIFYVLHDGAAGVLGVGGFHVHFHSVRLRIHRRRSSVSAGHFAAGPGAGAAIHAVPVSDVFSGEHLSRTNHRHGAVARAVRPGVLGGGD